MFAPSRDTESRLEGSISSPLHDLEESLGRYSVRTARRFHNFISRQPEYPLVLTPLPFTAVEQILFMATSQVIPTNSCKCDRCKAHNSQFGAVLECLADKYKSARGEFMFVAHQVLCKIACGQTMFTAVFTGETIGTKRIRKYGSLLFPGWDLEPIDHRQARNFEYRPFVLHPDLAPKTTKARQPPLIYMTTSLIQSAETIMQHFECTVSKTPSGKLCPPKLCDKILTRAHAFFSSVYARNLFVRIYFLGVASNYYITVRVTRTTRLPKSHPHYEIFILKGSMYTNIQL